MIKIYNISDYQPKSGDVFFFDNNIWMYLFCPIANSEKEKQRKYSAFYNQVITVKACIWINSLVVSEFCNAWLRYEYENWKKKPENYQYDNYKKDFIPSQAYKQVTEDIKQTLPSLLKTTERTTDSFNNINIDKVINQLIHCDFNDSYYLELARMNKWKLVSDDADLMKNNQICVEIITANHCCPMKNKK
jgi:hypothetical protein